MRSRISIRGFVRPSVCPSVRLLRLFHFRHFRPKKPHSAWLHEHSLLFQDESKWNNDLKNYTTRYIILLLASALGKKDTSGTGWCRRALVGAAFVKMNLSNLNSYFIILILVHQNSFYHFYHCWH